MKRFPGKSSIGLTENNNVRARISLEGEHRASLYPAPNPSTIPVKHAQRWMKKSLFAATCDRFL